MENMDKVVVRYLDGKMQKGLVKNFSVEADELLLEEPVTGNELRVPLGELKAVFFVRSLEGDPSHREKKLFGARKDGKDLGKKIYIKFKDNETLYGFYRGDLPWKQGYFVTEPHGTSRGFFVAPTDSESNNIRIFVVGTSIKDITVITP
ncbi:MAG TPA: hypothetical protein VN604_10785 [Nitrospirota bacterium]|nr:hypothetical protein [Nitrospirota bacterium]